MSLEVFFGKDRFDLECFLFLRPVDIVEIPLVKRYAWKIGADGNRFQGRQVVFFRRFHSVLLRLLCEDPTRNVQTVEKQIPHEMKHVGETATRFTGETYSSSICPDNRTEFDPGEFNR